MKQALVTGATGFLGRALINRLVKKGYSVTGIIRNASKRNDIPENISVVDADITNDAQLYRQIKKSGVINSNTTIFHTAALLGAIQARQKDYMKVNVHATKKMLELAIRFKAKKFVFVSSMGAAGPIGSLQNPINESMRGKPVSYYSESKWVAEQEILKNAPKSLPTIILRPPNIYGPGMNPKSGAALIFNGCRSKIFGIVGMGNNYINFAYIDNIIDGIIQCAENSRAGKQIFFISDEKPYQVNEIIKEIKMQWKSNTKILKVPYWVTWPFAIIIEKISKAIKKDIGFNSELIKGLATDDFVFSIDKAKKAGFSPKVSLKEGIKRTIDYLKSLK